MKLTLRLLRMEAGLAQHELAKLADVHQASISRIERGDFERCHARVLQKIAFALRTRLKELESEDIPSAREIIAMMDGTEDTEG